MMPTIEEFEVICPTLDGDEYFVTDSNGRQWRFVKLQAENLRGAFERVYRHEMQKGN